MSGANSRQPDERLAAWVDGELSPRERERMQAELRVNPQLRAELADYERTVALVRAALRPESTTAASAAFVQRVQDAVGRGSASGPSLVRPRPLALLWGLSAAAVLLASLVWLQDALLRPERHAPAATDLAARAERRPTGAAEDLHLVRPAQAPPDAPAGAGFAGDSAAGDPAAGKAVAVPRLQESAAAAEGAGPPAEGAGHGAGYGAAPEPEIQHSRATEPGAVPSAAGSEPQPLAAAPSAKAAGSRGADSQVDQRADLPQQEAILQSEAILQPEVKERLDAPDTLELRRAVVPPGRPASAREDLRGEEARIAGAGNGGPGFGKSGIAAKVPSLLVSVGGPAADSSSASGARGETGRVPAAPGTADQGRARGAPVAEGSPSRRSGGAGAAREPEAQSLSPYDHFFLAQSTLAAEAAPAGERDSPAAAAKQKGAAKPAAPLGFDASLAAGAVQTLPGLRVWPLPVAGGDAAAADRAWVVEGAPVAIQALVRALSRFAAEHGYQVQNGEEDAAVVLGAAASVPDRDAPNSPVAGGPGLGTAGAGKGAGDKKSNDSGAAAEGTPTRTAQDRSGTAAPELSVGSPAPAPAPGATQPAASMRLVLRFRRG